MIGTKVMATQKLMLHDPYEHKDFGVFMEIGDTATVSHQMGCCFSVIRDNRNGTGDDYGIFNQCQFKVIG